MYLAHGCILKVERTALSVCAYVANMAQASDGVVIDIACTLYSKARSSFVLTSFIVQQHCRPHTIATVLNVSDLCLGKDRLRDSKASPFVILEVSRVKWKNTKFCIWGLLREIAETVSSYGGC